MATFKHINGGYIIAIDDSRGAKRTEELSQRVDRQFAPWELPENAVGESHGRIEVSAGDTGGVDAEHDSESRQLEAVFCERAPY